MFLSLLQTWLKVCNKRRESPKLLRQANTKSSEDFESVIQNGKKIRIKSGERYWLLRNAPTEDLRSVCERL